MNNMMNWLREFPEGVFIDMNTPINEAVVYLSNNFAFVFEFIKAMLLGFTQSVQYVVEIIPWWIIIVVVGLWG